MLIYKERPPKAFLDLLPWITVTNAWSPLGFTVGWITHSKTDFFIIIIFDWLFLSFEGKASPKDPGMSDSSSLKRRHTLGYFAAAVGLAG